MKKVLILLTTLIFAISLISADQHQGMDAMESKNVANPTLFDTQKQQIRSGDSIQLQDGKTLRLMQQEKLRLQVGEHVAECTEECNLSQENGKIYAKMSNGINSEIKIMPDTASQRALERLRLKLCENCTLELKEVSQNNQNKMVYEFKAQKKARILGVFKKDMPVEAQIDAETGEVIRSKKPWWAFIASESDEAEPIEE